MRTHSWYRARRRKRKADGKRLRRRMASRFYWLRRRYRASRKTLRPILEAAARARLAPGFVEGRRAVITLWNDGLVQPGDYRTIFGGFVDIKGEGKS